MANLYVHLKLYFLLILTALIISIKSQEFDSENHVILEKISAQLEQLKNSIENFNSQMKLVQNAQPLMNAHLSDFERNITHLHKLIRSEVKAVLQDDSKNINNRKLKNPTKSMQFCGETSENYMQTFNVAKNCIEATSTNDFQDNMYLMNIPTSELNPFCVYCIHDHDDEKSWTIIQRREDGSEKFNRNWADYKQGFGNVYGEYWLGLERLHHMTKDQPHELWISLEDYNGETRYAIYEEFSIDSEDEGYRLSVGNYTGNAGNSFGRHNDMKFSTYDVDNDLVRTHCARKFKGGWWYKNCYDCHLNGVFYTNSNKNTEFGINWNAWHSYTTSLKYTHMAIRPL